VQLGDRVDETGLLDVGGHYVNDDLVATTTEELLTGQGRPHFEKTRHQVHRPGRWTGLRDLCRDGHVVLPIRRG